MAIILLYRASSSRYPGRDGDTIRNRLLYKLGICASSSGDESSFQSYASMAFPENQNRRCRNASGPPIDVDYTIHAHHHVQTRTVPGRSQNSSCPDPYWIPLKFALDADCQPPNQFVFPEPPASINALNPVSPRTKKNVKFNASVSVVPIPSHRSYSPRIHSRIYTSKPELAASAARNTHEFTYEGWNWRNVIENDGLYVCGVSGQLVHPAHVHSRWLQVDRHQSL